MVGFVLRKKSGACAPITCLKALSNVLLVVFIIIVIAGVGLLRIVLCFLLVILLFLLCFLHFRQCLPLASERVCFSNVVGDDDVVEDGLSLHLPKIKTDETKLAKFVNGIIIDKFRIVDLLGLPHSLVLWIVLHRCLPLTIFLVIPVVRLLRLC